MDQKDVVGQDADATAREIAKKVLDSLSVAYRALTADFEIQTDRRQTREDAIDLFGNVLYRPRCTPITVPTGRDRQPNLRDP